MNTGQPAAPADVGALEDEYRASMACDVDAPWVADGCAIAAIVERNAGQFSRSWSKRARATSSSAAR